MTVSRDQLAEALGVAPQYREPPLPAWQIRAQRELVADAEPESVERAMREARLKEMEGKGRDR